MCLAVPGRVLDVFIENGIRMGTVDFGGVRRKACLEYEPGIGVGSYAMVHVGFAISAVDAEEADRSFALLEETSGLRV